jgi:amino acid adenylation domain-containing protein
MKISEIINKLFHKGIYLSLDNSNNIVIDFNDNSLDDNDLNTLKNNKQSIVQYLLMHKEQDDRIVVSHTNKNAIYPVSNSQKRLWILDKIDGGSLHYNIPVIYEINGNLNIAALNDAFNYIINKHEILRTNIYKKGGDILQKVNPFKLQKLTFTDLSSQKLLDHTLDNIIDKFINRDFDLENDQLIYYELIKLAEKKYYLMINIHHIIFDGWSNVIFISELANFYNQTIKNNQIDNTADSDQIQYKDFAIWQSKHILSNNVQPSKLYWNNIFSTVKQNVGFPIDNIRPVKQSFNGNTIEFVFNRELNKYISKLTKKFNTSKFIILYSIINILLYKYTNQKDITIGTIHAGREREEFEKLIGFFVNTIPIRNKLNPDVTFSNYIEEVKNDTVSAFEHQNYPFDLLIEDLKIPKDQSRSPLFDVLIAFQSIEKPKIDTFTGLKITEKKIKYNYSKFDISFYFSEDQINNIKLLLEYNTDLYTEKTIINIVEHLEKLISEVAQNNDATLESYQILTSKDHNIFIENIINIQQNIDKKNNIIDVFTQIVAMYSDKVAVKYKDKCLTFEELDKLSNGVANYLISNIDITNQGLIGLMVSRSELMVVNILGILKAGAGYVPIDRTHPQNRIKMILQESNVKSVIVDNITDDKLDTSMLKINIDDLLKNGKINNYYKPPKQIHNSDIAYVMFTSGSTGKPKGIIIEHQSVVSFLENMTKTFGLSNQDIILGLTTITFDISVLEIICSILIGMQVVVLADEERMDYQSIVKIIEEKDISVIQITPPHLNKIIETCGLQKLKKVKTYLIGGDIFNDSLLAKLSTIRNTKNIYNVYGPTEATIWSTAKLLSTNQRLNIGVSLIDEKVFIIDNNYRLLPSGIAGEICIAGKGLSRGYFNNPTANKEKFIYWNPKSFSISNESKKDYIRIYKTGDLGRLLSNDDIEFLGRKDFQVKINGYRIETKEIELAISKVIKLTNVIVGVTEKYSKDQELIAYIETNDQNINIKQLRSNLRGELPVYMIPSYFILVPKFPLNTNGKIDRNILSSLDINANEKRISDEVNSFDTPTSKILIEIWQKILKNNIINCDDSFFEIGGNSLKVIELIAQINKRLNIKLEVNTIFEHPTINDLGQLIDNNYSHINESKYINLNSHYEKLPNLIFLPHFIGESNIFRNIAKTLEGKFNVIGIQYNTNLNSKFDNFILSLAKSIITDLESLSLRIEYIVGYSFGGYVAFEMAKLLKKLKIKLILIDTYWNLQTENKNNLEIVINDELNKIFDGNKELRDKYYQIGKNNLSILFKYKIKGKVDNNIILIEAKDTEDSLLELKSHNLNWQKHTKGNLQRYIVSGDHYNILNNKYYNKIANIIKDN